MRFKGLTAVIAALTIFLTPNGFCITDNLKNNCDNAVYAADEQTNSSYDAVAVAVLGDTAELNGFDMVETGKSGKNEVSVQGGSKCWVLNKMNGSQSGYLNMNLSSEFKKNNDGSVYTIEVEYYDVSNGYFRLLYDRKNNENKVGQTFYMTNAVTWKTASLTVDDADFKHGIEGKYDIQLSIFAPSTQTTISPSSIAVRKITVKKKTNANPIYVTSTVERGGNSFEWYSDEKIIHNEYQNFSNEKKMVNIKHSFVNNYGLKVYEKEEKLTISPKEKIKTDFNFSDLRRSDIYWYRINISDDSGEINSTFKPFEIAILKTDPNGIKNEYVYFASHLERRTGGNEEANKIGWNIFKMANNGGTRGGMDSWSYSYEIAKRVFRVQSDNSLAYKVKEDAGGNIVILSGNSPRYGTYSDMPVGKDQIEDWRAYVRETVKGCKGIFNTYEIWNEPNILSFNRNNVRGDGYMEIFNAAYEEIKKIDPDAIVIGPCITGPHVEMGYSYYYETLDAGLWKNADGISIHPYASYTIERTPEVVAGVKDFIDRFVEKSGREPLIYLTELGYSRADKPIGRSARRLGIYNARSVLFYESRELANKLCFHQFEDGGVVLTDHEDMFGHVSCGQETKYNTYFVPNEAYAIITGLNYVMAETVPDGILDIEDEDIYISKYKSNKFDKNIISMYSLDEPKNVTLKLDVDSVSVYDEFGNETKVYGQDGLYSFLVGKAPMYIVGDFNETSVCDKSFVDFGTGMKSIAQNENFELSISVPDDKCDVELNVPESMEVIGITKNNDNRIDVLIKNSGKVGENSYIEAYIKKNEKVIALGKYETETIEPMESSLDVEPLDSSDVSWWQGTLKLKNKSQFSTARGKVIFNEPESVSGMEFDIGVIPVGKTGEISFTLPQITKMGSQTYKYTIALDNGASFEYADKLNFAVAKYAEKKPTIDGIIEPDEWPSDAAMYANEQGQTKKLDNWSKYDVSARTMVMWDEDNFYLASEVTDDVHCNIQPPSKNWNGDNIQFGVFYGEAAYLAIGQGGQSFHEISASLNSQTSEISVWRYKSQDNVYPAGQVTEAECKITRNEETKKTTYEIRMPWSALLKPGNKPKAGEYLGFSYVINETDSGEREGWIEYAGGIAESKDTSLFTYMKL